MARLPLVAWPARRVRPCPPVGLRLVRRRRPPDSQKVRPGADRQRRRQRRAAGGRPRPPVRARHMSPPTNAHAADRLDRRSQGRPEGPEGSRREGSRGTRRQGARGSARSARRPSARPRPRRQQEPRRLCVRSSRTARTAGSIRARQSPIRATTGCAARHPVRSRCAPPPPRLPPSPPRRSPLRPCRHPRLTARPRRRAVPAPASPCRRCGAGTSAPDARRAPSNRDRRCRAARRAARRCLRPHRRADAASRRADATPAARRLPTTRAASRSQRCRRAAPASRRPCCRRAGRTPSRRPPVSAAACARRRQLPLAPRRCPPSRRSEQGLRAADPVGRRRFGLTALPSASAAPSPPAPRRGEGRCASAGSAARTDRHRRRASLLRRLTSVSAPPSRPADPNKAFVPPTGWTLAGAERRRTSSRPLQPPPPTPVLHCRHPIPRTSPGASAWHLRRLLFRCHVLSDPNKAFVPPPGWTPPGAQRAPVVAAARAAADTTGDDDDRGAAAADAGTDSGAAIASGHGAAACRCAVAVGRSQQGVRSAAGLDAAGAVRGANHWPPPCRATVVSPAATSGDPDKAFARGAAPAQSARRAAAGGPLQVAVIQFGAHVGRGSAARTRPCWRRWRRSSAANGGTVRIVAHADAGRGRLVGRGPCARQLRSVAPACARGRQPARASSVCRSHRIAAEAASDEEPIYQTNYRPRPRRQPTRRDLRRVLARKDKKQWTIRNSTG